MDEYNEYEVYDKGPIVVRFKDLPSIRLVTIKPDKDIPFWHRLKLAMKKRIFHLTEDWEIHFDNVSYQKQLNGVITIPSMVNGRFVDFDGASVPFARTISWLTQGILSPLGVMYTASVVHDFAYKHGYLVVLDDSDKALSKKVFIERHHADLLFRDIITTVNKVAVVGWIAWFAVRIGWVFVRYDDKKFGGKYPILEQSVFLIFMALFTDYLFDDGFFQLQNTWPLLGVIIFFPMVLWFIVKLFTAAEPNN